MINSSFYVVDGPAMAYRSIFTSGQRLSSPDGEPTWGIYYFCRTFLKLVRASPPDYLAVAWDPPRHTLERRAWFPQYKAKRGDPDPEVSSQIERIVEILWAWGVPVIEEPGWEADDVIASLVDICAGPEVNTIIVGSDKDFLQLLDAPNTVLHNPSDGDWTRARDVRPLWGVSPGQMVDLQTMMGDSVDCIPGILGVGKKTAVALLQEYGSLNNILENLEDLSASMQERFEAADIPLMRRLVSLNRGLNVQVSEEQLEHDSLNMKRAGPIFRSLGFKRWSK